MSQPNVHGLLTPENCTVIFIDHQPQMAFGVANIDRQTLKNNTIALAKSAKVFNVPTILTTVETKAFSGYMWPELLDVFPGQEPIERSSMNSWEDVNFKAAVEKAGRKKLVMAALWTEVCLAFPTIQAIEDGYEVYIVVDASGGTSQVAHDTAITRMVQAGAVPVTWQQVLLEFQRDWAKKETYNAVIDIVSQHSGAYGMGVDYAYTMVHGQPPRLVHKEASLVH
jgi:nicotinamidase-related amidase